jgi:hypothetical protein
MRVWANTHVRGKFMSGPGGLRFNLNKVPAGKELSNRSGGRETPPLMPRATKVTEEARQTMPASAKKGSAIHSKGKPKVRPPERPPARPTVPAPTLAPRRAESARTDALGEPPPQGNEEAKISPLGAPPARPTMPPPTRVPPRPGLDYSKLPQRADVDYRDLPPLAARVDGNRFIVIPNPKEDQSTS